MNPTRFLRLLAGATCAPLAALTYADPPPPPPAAADSGSSSTSISTSVTDGKGTITITVEKDGKKETRTLNLNSDDPAKLAEELVEKIQDRSDATPPPAKKKVTYLGVMFAEAAEGSGGQWPLGTPGGGLGDGGGGSIGGGGGSIGGGGGSIGGGGGSIGGGAAPATGLPAGTGLAISGVSSGSPAEKAGLKAGDVLAKLDDQILVNPAQFTTLIRNRKEGDTIKLAFVRDGEAKDLGVTLATREEEPSSGFAYYGAGGQRGPGRPLFRSGKGFAGFGSGDVAREGRVLRLEKDGRVLEEWVGGDTPPRLTPPQPPGAPPAPPAPPTPGSQDQFLKFHESPPQWEKALREAADVRDQATEQWQKQLADWRKQWAKTQEQTAAEYRRAMEKMGEEIRKATEAAHKAQEEARRAIEAWKDKRFEEKPAPPAEEKKDPDQPKKG